ncbi:NifU family protein [Spirochaeta lutea]|uniref:Nitrogen fixation protein NifU n=1 Tax=Spirochaeta lutea TaxID=1480694 RepID=A0A098QZK9_9SPIO|nr:NifU family protein [Spirochaeta lutea]KGE71917.1 nitrogen fixation protein NifU [Spirochaeta lutea]
MTETLADLIQRIRPALQQDGGDIELIRVTESNQVVVRLTGACNGCPMSQITLKQGIERFLKEQLPEISEVIQE